MSQTHKPIEDTDQSPIRNRYLITLVRPVVLANGTENNCLWSYYYMRAADNSVQIGQSNPIDMSADNVRSCQRITNPGLKMNVKIEEVQ